MYAWQRLFHEFRGKTDNTDIPDRIEGFNAGLVSMCQDSEHFKLINNDDYFSLKDGEINDGYILLDGTHLTKKDTNKLTKSLWLRTMRSSKVRRRRPPYRLAHRQLWRRCDPFMHAVGRAGWAQAFPLVPKQTHIKWRNVLWNQSGHDQIPGTGEESTRLMWVGVIAIVQQLNNSIPTHHHYQDVLNVMKPTTCLTLVAINIRSYV